MDNLVRHGVIMSGIGLYVGGCEMEESVNHLFFG
jgi:hypothetical protein